MGILTIFLAADGSLYRAAELHAALHGQRDGESSLFLVLALIPDGCRDCSCDVASRTSVNGSRDGSQGFQQRLCSGILSRPNAQVGKIDPIGGCLQAIPKIRTEGKNDEALPFWLPIAKGTRIIFDFAVGELAQDLVSPSLFLNSSKTFSRSPRHE
jgi:hypothetical protein